MLEIYITPGLCTILYYNEAFAIYGLSSKLVFLFVQPVVFVQPQNTLAYCEICHFPINCGFRMFYCTGPWSQGGKTFRVKTLLPYWAYW